MGQICRIIFYRLGGRMIGISILRTCYSRVQVKRMWIILS